MWDLLKQHIIGQFQVTTTKLILVYVVVYIPIGFVMNQVGIWSRIARFRFWWQVLTCYGLYMIPVSILLKDFSFHEQYVWGLFAMALLEFSGYLLGTSIVLGVKKSGNLIQVEKNIMVRLLGIENFSLGMALFFALYFPLGNQLVNYVYPFLF